MFALACHALPALPNQPCVLAKEPRVRAIINSFMIGGDLRAWRRRHSDASVRAFTDLAADVVARAEAEANRLGPSSLMFGQRDFLSDRVKTLLRGTAEPLAARLLDTANDELALIADIEAVRVRGDDYALPAKGLVVDLGEAMLTMLPLGRTAALHQRLRDYVHTSLIAGPKGRPAVLEQLLAAYADAVKRALKS